MLATLLVLSGLVFAPSPVPRAVVAPKATPCITPTTACEQWIVYGGGPARSLTYSSYPLTKKNAQVTRALIMVHGAGRNADHYFSTALAAGFLAGAIENTVIVAPRFISGPDKPEANEVVWPNAWRSGGISTSHPPITSFDLMDEIVRKLADKKTFPNLTQIVIAGHSAGGQVTTRYQMTNKLHGTIGVKMTYVVANPSTYAWPVALRPLPTGDGDPATTDKEALGPNGEKVNTNFAYGPLDSTKAPRYNRWPAGLDSLSGYTAGMTADQLRKQLVERPATYLLGQVDILPLGGFDSSATAMAQGPTRRSRGEAFFKYVTETMGAKHTAIIVSECGHNDRCVFTTDVVLPLIFPKE